MELRGSSVLLTGATGGIGHAIARHLHGAGASLLLTGRRTDVLEPLAAEVGGRATAVDLADRAAVDRLLEEAGDVDILVANAALPASGDILDFTPEQIDRALDVNLRAPMMMARVLGERMAARGRGHIVLISSLSGKSGQPGSAIYSATKFGLRGFGQGLRGDLGPRGVGVSTVFPGFIRDAGMFHESGTKLPKGVGHLDARPGRRRRRQGDHRRQGRGRRRPGQHARRHGLRADRAGDLGALRQAHGRRQDRQARSPAGRPTSAEERHGARRGAFSAERLLAHAPSPRPAER